MNMMNQQDMIVLKDYNHIVLQPVDYKLDMSIASKQNFVDLTTQHKIEEICNVDNIRSLEEFVLLEKPSAIPIELLG
jgi:hypothetical protein